MNCQIGNISRSIYIDIEKIDPLGKIAYECEKLIKNNKSLSEIFIERLKKMFTF